MTSPSHKSRRITAWSTLRTTRSDALHGAALLLVGFLLGGNARAADRPPLERLEQRSAESRWQQARRQWANEAAPAAPALDDLPPAPPPPPRDDPFADPAASAERAPPAPPPDDLPRDVVVPAPTEDLDPPAFKFVHSWEADGLPEGPLPLVDFLRNSPESEAPTTEALAVQYRHQPLSSNPPVFRPISQIQPFHDYEPAGGDPCEHLCPAPAGLCPDDPNRLCPDPVTSPVQGSTERFFAPLEFYWQASNLRHNPLYFEDPALERYGHVHYNDCVEPVFSLARFSALFVALPYQMALDPMWKRQYELGWYRPGDFAPKRHYQPPLNGRAAVTAAGVYTGLFLLVP